MGRQGKTDGRCCPVPSYFRIKYREGRYGASNPTKKCGNGCEASLASQRGFFWGVDEAAAPVLADGVLTSSKFLTARASTSGVKGFCKKLLVPSSCPAMMPMSSMYPDM